MNYHPLTQKIKQLLIENKCRFETFEHTPVRTSEDAAKVRTGYTLSQGAKALILRVKRNPNSFTKPHPNPDLIEVDPLLKGEGILTKFVMLVIPGDKRFDKQKVQILLNTKDIRFATEEEVAEITGGVLVGGVPPFGNFFGLKVYADPQILQNEKIIFNAGDRSYSIAMLAEDYQKIVKPEIVNIIQSP